MKERIVLSLELIADDGKDARCCMIVPYDLRGIIFGPWLDQAVKDLRAECKEALAEKRQYDGDGDHY